MTSPNLVSENSQSQPIADAATLTLISDLQARVAQLEAQIAPRLCCECSRPEECGDLDCPDARHYDSLESLNRQLIAESDVFGIGPAGSAADMAEAFRYPPPPHVGQRRAADLMEHGDRLRIHSYAAHARACTSFDGGAA